MSQKSKLLVTTGHNSSVIRVRFNQVMEGYEEERLTRVKSDSRMPLNAMMSLQYNDYDEIYVTHWEPSNNLLLLKDKYWSLNVLNPKVEVFTHGRSCPENRDVTHHDTHAWAACAFAGNSFPVNKSYLFVVDGFGNIGEHISIYELESVEGQLTPKLIDRYFGYETSIGLFYQYSTAYQGMKMHQDEYKMLGYEVHIDSALSDANRSLLEKIIQKHTHAWIRALEHRTFYHLTDPAISINALQQIQLKIFDTLDYVRNAIGIDDEPADNLRSTIVISYYTQAVVENVIRHLVLKYNPTNVIVAGGVFYNVKINHMIMRMVKNKFCAYPLAGDQGNAIGLYNLMHPNDRVTWPEHLFWGRRELYDPHVDGIVFAKPSDATEMALDSLVKYGMVNIVRGSMEFGPRALCNTSTLALPNSTEIVNKINRMNARTTVMPFAPVVHPNLFDILFKDTKNSWKNHEYMISAFTYNARYGERFIGAAHPCDQEFTGRPQVAKPNDHLLIKLLNEFNGVLINTSFNYHGEPIVYNMPTIIKNHKLQQDRNPDIVTIIVEGDES